MNHETNARKIHRRGTGCSSVVYTAFRDINAKASYAPSPRSEGGKCGAVLAAEKVLKETGTGKIEQFEQEFIRQFGTLKCMELLRTPFDCNDFVGKAAAIADSLLES